MLVKISTLRLMYKAGNKKVKELIDGGESLEGFTDRNREEIFAAMMRAFELSHDRSSGHDASNRAYGYIEELHDHLGIFEEFAPLEPYIRR